MNNVKVFYTDTCPYCKKLMKGLDDLNISYNKVDVDTEDGEKEFLELYEITNSNNIPVIIIGNQVLVPEIAFNTIKDALILIKKLF